MPSIHTELACLLRDFLLHMCQVTPAMYAAIAAGQAASSVLCAANDCYLSVVDVGIDSDVQHIKAAAAAPHITTVHSKVRAPIILR